MYSLQSDNQNVVTRTENNKTYTNNLWRDFVHRVRQQLSENALYALLLGVVVENWASWETFSNQMDQQNFNIQ